MKKNQITISDVAAKAGVSRSTVSRVLNNQPGVGEDVRAFVQKCIEEMNYVPNTLAKSLIQGNTNIVALIFGDVRNPFYAELAFYIQKYLNEAGYMVMALNSEYNSAREMDYIQMARQFSFAGLILLTAQTPELNNFLQQNDIPTILVNRTFEIPRGDSVSLDNFQAGYLAGKHLIELRHRKIAFIAGPMSSPSSKLRYQGFLQVMQNFQIDFDESKYLYSSNLKMESGYEAGKKFAQQYDGTITAAVVSNDMAAIGFMEACYEAGISVPDSLSVVSFDNIIFSGLHMVGLTTIDQHPQKMSRIAVDFFLKRIKEINAPSTHIMLEPVLIARTSTKENTK